MSQLVMTAEGLTRVHDYGLTYTSDTGSRVLEDMEKSYGQRISFVAGDAYLTAYQEGQRSVLLAIKDILAI